MILSLWYCFLIASPNNSQNVHANMHLDGEHIEMCLHGRKTSKHFLHISVPVNGNVIYFSLLVHLAMLICLNKKVVSACSC